MTQKHMRFSEEEAARDVEAMLERLRAAGMSAWWNRPWSDPVVFPAIQPRLYGDPIPDPKAPLYQ